MTGSKLVWPLHVRMAATSWPDVRPWRSPKGKGRPWQASFPSTTLLMVSRLSTFTGRPPLPPIKVFRLRRRSLSDRPTLARLRVMRLLSRRLFRPGPLRLNR